MNTKVDEANEQEIIEKATAAEMARIAGVTEPEVEPEPEATEEPEADAPEPEAEPKEPTVAEQFAEMRAENDKLKKALERTNGTYGSELQKLRSRLDATPAQPTTDVNALFNRLNVEDPAFAELIEEFPELTGGFVKAFRKALIGDSETPSTPAAISTTHKVTEQQEPERRTVQDVDPSIARMALDTLQTKHPDFLTLAEFESKELAPGMVSVKWKDPNFGEWIDTMPDDVRESILVGGSVAVPSAAQILRIADIMTEYKSTVKPAPTDQDEQEPITAIKPKPKVDLQRTLMPNSRQKAGKVALTDEEIIEQAMRRTMREEMNGMG